MTKPVYLKELITHLLTPTSYGDEVLVFDNSALCILEECQRKFLYAVLLSLKPPVEKPAITFGSAMHKFLEFYHAGRPFQECFEGFVRVAMAENSRIAVKREQSLDINLVSEYSMEFGYILCKKYAETHPLDKEYFTVLKDSNGKPYLETGFALDLPNGIVIGLIDGLGSINYNQRKMVVDHKTTKMNLNQSWLAQFNPNNQISTYLYAATEYLGEELTVALINAVRVKDYQRGSKEEIDRKLFNRIEVSRSPEQLEQRMRHANFQLLQIRQSIDYGLDGFPQHTQSCITKYGECEYRRLCLAKNDLMLQLLIEGSYRKQVWRPYDVFANSETENVIEVDIHNLDEIPGVPASIKKPKVDVRDKNKYLTDRGVKIENVGEIKS